MEEFRKFINDLDKIFELEVGKKDTKDIDEFLKENIKEYVDNFNKVIKKLDENTISNNISELKRGINKIKMLRKYVVKGLGVDIKIDEVVNILKKDE